MMVVIILFISHAAQSHQLQLVQFSRLWQNHMAQLTKGTFSCHGWVWCLLSTLATVHRPHLLQF